MSLVVAGLVVAHTLATQTDTSRHAQVLVRAGKLVAPRTGTVLTMSPTTTAALTVARGWATTRWANAGTASSFTSSGVAYPRPSATAIAEAARSTANAARGEAPTARSGCPRVAPTMSRTYERTETATKEVVEKLLAIPGVTNVQTS